MNSTLLLVLINGLLLGGIYALLSIGLTIAFGIVRVVNFAHGDFLMLAMYSAYSMVTFTRVTNPYLSVIVVAPLFFVLGMLMYRFLIKPIINAPAVSQIFSTVGLSIVLQNIALMVWGPDFKSLQTQITTVRFGVMNISQGRLIAFVVSFILVFALLAFLKYNFLGRAITAVAQDREAAMIVGIDVNYVYLITMGIAISSIGVAGVMLAPIYAVFPETGLYFVLIAFVVVILGGFGNITGVILGGLIIGLIDSLSGFYLQVAFKEATYFLVFILILWLKPAGILGNRNLDVM